MVRSVIIILLELIAYFNLVCAFARLLVMSENVTAIAQQKIQALRKLITKELRNDELSSEFSNLLKK